MRCAALMTALAANVILRPITRFRQVDIISINVTQEAIITIAFTVLRTANCWIDVFAEYVQMSSRMNAAKITALHTLKVFPKLFQIFFNVPFI